MLYAVSPILCYVPPTFPVIRTLIYQSDINQHSIVQYCYKSNLRISSLFGLYNFTICHLFSCADFSLLYMYMFSCVLSTLKLNKYVMLCLYYTGKHLHKNDVAVCKEYINLRKYLQIIFNVC